MVGVKVSVEGSSKIATTDSTGRFTLSGIPDGNLIVSVNASGITAQNGDTYGNYAGRLKIMKNVLNRPHRDYMLPRVDAVGMAMVEPTKETVIDNTNIKVKLTVPMGAVENSDGTPYTGSLSVSEVPIDATPRELPETLRPSQLLTLQPIGLRFTSPADITFPNTDNLPPGTVMDLFSLSERGGFEKVGRGMVSDDGESISLFEGGIRSTTWHLVAVSLPTYLGVSSREGGVDGNNNTQASMCPSVGSAVCTATGVLEETHNLAAFKDSGETIVLQLGFKNPSSQMTPTLFPEFKYEPVFFRNQDGAETFVNQNPPQMMGMSYEIGGVATTPSFFQTQVLMGTTDSGFTTGQSIDTRGISTGVYPVTSRLELISGSSANPSVRMMKNEFFLPVISPKTDFGMGWTLKGLARIYGINGEVSHNSEKIMIVHDSFKYLIFTRNSDGSYTSPKGDYTTLRVLSSPFAGFLWETKQGLRFVFNKDGFLLGRTDRYGRETSFHYDSQNKLTSITHPSKRKTTFTYGTDGLIGTVTDPAGRVTAFHHDAFDNLTQITEPDMSTKKYEYGENHALLAQFDKLDRETTYAYDAKGNLIRSIRPDGSTVAFESATSRLIGEGGKGTRSNPFTVGLQEGANESKTIDSKGGETTFAFNEYGTISGIINAMGGQVRLFYDENNNLIERVDENGNRYTYTYDSFGNLTTRTTPIGTVKLEYLDNPQDNFHQPVAIVDAKGNKTTFEYDEYGNMTKLRDPLGQLTKLTYKNNYLPASVTETATQTGYTYEYDTNGNPAVITDRLHRILLKNSYDTVGNLILREDAKGNKSTFTYDKLSRLLTRVDAKGNTVVNTYDKIGNLLTQTDQKGKITRLSYDNADNLIERIDALGKSEFFFYDTNRNLTSKTDRNGETIEYEYDPLNRLIARIYPDGQRDTYLYDPKGNMLSAKNAYGTIGLTYDEEDRIASTSNSEIGVVLGYTYDNNGNRTSLVDLESYGFGDVLYDYDKNNQLIKLGHTFDLDPNGIKIDLTGRRRESLLYPNGIVANYSWVPGKTNRIRHLEYIKGNTTLSSFNYAYDKNDQVTGLKTNRGNLSLNTDITYGYDVLNQLTSATKPIGNGDETFSYDSIGNILKKEGETVDSTFNDNHQLTNDKTYNHTYDDNGNLIKSVHIGTGRIVERSWDYLNRLTGIIKKNSEHAHPTSVIAYRYDSFGRRVEKDVDGEITRYVYDGDNIYLELNERNILRARYLHGSGPDDILKMERFESPFKNESFPNQEFYYHKDRLGNVTEITDFDGDVVQRYVYDSFGNVTIYDESGNVITPSSSKYLKNPFFFTGREMDFESNCYFYRARYYCPQMNLFISEEPFGIDGPHLYWYGRNNTINYIDPNGLDAVFFSLDGTAGTTHSFTRDSDTGKIKLYGDVYKASGGIIVGTEGNGFSAQAFTATGLGDRITGTVARANFTLGYILGDVSSIGGRTKTRTLLLDIVAITSIRNEKGEAIGGSISFGGRGAGLADFFLDVDTFFLGGSKKQVCPENSQ